MSSYAELYVSEDVADFFKKELNEEFGTEWYFDTIPFMGINDISSVIKIDVLNYDEEKIGEVEVRSISKKLKDDFGYIYLDWYPKKILITKVSGVVKYLVVWLDKDGESINTYFNSNEFDNAKKFYWKKIDKPTEAVLYKATMDEAGDDVVSKVDVSPKEFKDGGGVARNKGRDWIFKSKQKWEQDYDRKREWKEYKKEGWFANWFKDGGEAKDRNTISLYETFLDDKNIEVSRLLVQGVYSEERLKKFIERATEGTFEMFDKGRYDYKQEVFVHPRNVREPFLDKYKKFKDGGEAKDYDFDEFIKRQAIISEAVKFAFIRAIGFDDAYNLKNEEYFSISPYRLVERAVSGEFIGVHEINKDVIESAIDEAREVTRRYEDSGQGIGSSDMTAFLKNFLDDAGFKTAFISSRLERIDENGNAIKVKSDLPNTTMFKNGGDADGYVENIPTETLEAMIGRKLNGWNDDKVIFNGIVYKKCFMRPYYEIA